MSEVQTDPKDGNGKKQPITNDPDEAITTPEQVEESNDKKIDEDFPGYPHYPAKDDILNPENNSVQVDFDVENLTRLNELPPENITNQKSSQSTVDYTSLSREAEVDYIANDSTSTADVTAEDLAMLGDKDEDMDMGEDEELKAKGWTPKTGEDLDIPGSELDDELAQEDEENSYYSLGGDRVAN